jgi:hypothetical protein
MIIKLLISFLFVACHSFYLHTLFSESSEIDSINFSPDVSMVVMGSTSNTHNVYYFPGMTLAHAFATTNPCKCAKFSPNQAYVAFALNNYKIVIKETNNFTTTHTITSNFNSIN